jgi:Protein of unknown function (DUF1572)
MQTIALAFLQTAIKRFAFYKDLGDKTFAQLQEADFYFQPNEASNSIAVIIQHMGGNMLSRWTNFLTEDGEKAWRNRDIEFETHAYSKEELLGIWETGWRCMFDALEALTEEDLLKTIYIRTEAQSVIDAINRQLAHYPYHVGQIVYVGRQITNDQWQSLSIPKGNSDAYNQQLANKHQ